MAAEIPPAPQACDWVPDVSEWCATDSRLSIQALFWLKLQQGWWRCFTCCDQEKNSALRVYTNMANSLIWSSHYCAANLLDFSIRMCTSLVWTKEHSIKTHFHLILSTSLMSFLFGAMDASHQEMTIWVPKSIYGAMLNQQRDDLSAVCFRL